MALAGQSVLIIGAGIAGLFSALTLSGKGHQITLLERDPPPPEGDAESVFETWSRRGVGQMRQSHAFLARLRSSLVSSHPALLAALRAAGCREMEFQRALTDRQRRRYRPRPIDPDLVALSCRRTTLETVLRRYVADLPGVTIRSECFVEGLVLDRTGPRPRVLGARTAQGDACLADLVVDTGGRLTPGLEDLITEGCSISDESAEAGVLYYTRHFKLRDGLMEPVNSRGVVSGDLGFLKYCVFPADNGWFSITIAVAEIEDELRVAVVDPQRFDAICGLMPPLAPWLSASDGVGRVLAMGNLQSRWRDLAPEGKPLVDGYVALGDALIRANPLYGRGCTFAMIQAEALAEALTDHPSTPLAAFQAHVHQALRPYFDDMAKQDRAAIRQAARVANPDFHPNLKARLLTSFGQQGMAVAVRSDPDLFRQVIEGFHMLTPPGEWLKSRRNLAKAVAWWMVPKAFKRDVLPAIPGPGRTALMESLGLPVGATWKRLQAAA
jgi:hypothetical protein